MIKILHIVSSLSLGNGTMTMIMNYYKELDRENIQFDFLYFSEKNPSHAAEIIRMGGRTYKIGTPSFSPAYIKNANKFFEEYGHVYTAIHAHPIFAGVFFGRIAKANGISAIIQHSHSPKFSNKPISSLRNRIICWGFYKRVDYFIACSTVAMNLFPKGKRDEKNIFPNAIDYSIYEFSQNDRVNIRNELNLTPDNFVIGNVGRLSGEKNQIFLIDLLEKILGLEERAKLLLVGEGPEKEKLVNYAASKNVLDKIIFTGIRKDISSIMSSMDVFVLPSLFEGFGIVAIEAQSNSLPTFCSMEVPEDVNISNKFKRFELKENIEVLAKHIIKFRNDRFEKVENIDVRYDIKQVASKLECFYQSIEDNSEIKIHG